MGRNTAAPCPMHYFEDGATTCELCGTSLEEAKRQLGSARDSVAALLGRAAGAAEAMTDCGIDTDDTELVAHFIASMDHCRGMFEDIAKRMASEDPSLDAFDVANKSMQVSPAFTNPWFMWRLSAAFKSMASRDVLEAAREVVASYAGYGCPGGGRKLDSAMAKLAAALPKEH